MTRGLKRSREEQLDFCQSVVNAVLGDFNNKFNNFLEEYGDEPDPDISWSVVMRLLTSAKDTIEGAVGQIEYAQDKRIEEGQ